MNNIKLWDKTPFFDENINQPEPFLKPYIKDGAKSAVIVCPGGAYRDLAEHEGHPVALWLNSIGITAFVLTYRLAPYTEKAITGDILRAVRVVRSNAENFGIKKNKIGVLGFSAGGHLASSAAVHFSDFVFPKTDDTDNESPRPDAAILCYPVISPDSGMCHGDSFKNLLGEKFGDEKLMNYYSNEKAVKPDTPPCFLWHTGGDDGVPPENSMEFAKGLQKNKIPYEIHIYAGGRHGMGLAQNLKGENTFRIEKWTESCEEWLKSIDFI